MQENLVLFSFAASPLVLLFMFRRFFRRNRQKPTARRTLRLIIGNTLIGLLMLSIAVLGGEVYYRFYYDETDSFGLTKVTTRWFDRHFQFNASRFRDDIQYPATRLRGRRRITFVGAKPEVDIHVVAQCGWDTGAQLEFLHVGTQSGYEVDAVVLVYCLNDVADIIPEWQAVADRIYAAPKPGFFVQHSFLLNTFYYRLRALREPDIGNYYSFVRQGYTDVLWQHQRERLQTMRDLVESRGGTFLVVTFPFLHALGDDYAYQNLHEQLDQLWKELNVPHLDLLTAFERFSSDKVVVSPYDAHPNEFAHDLAATAILEFLDAELSSENVQ